MAKVFLLDDDPNFTSATSELLAMMGHQVTSAGSLAEADPIVREQSFDLAILDLMLPDGSGLHILETLTAQNSVSHIAVVTGHPAVKSLVRNLCGPTLSYLLKPIDLAQLRALLDKVERIDAPGDKEGLHYGFLVGESAVMKNLYEIIHRVSQSRANVMLLGESGVGKELVARAIHHASAGTGPYVAANCGALSRELIGSELFGHEKGAFTGALARKQGLFERADAGTLFLDEITEMPLDLQPTLLRALETRCVTRVGGTVEIPVNCRVVSATNRSMSDLAEKNCMREDLYFRLAVFPIEIPPLRSRKEDIPVLAQHFLHQLNVENGTSMVIHSGDLGRLQAYDWPGNVRELRHAIHRAFILTPVDARALALPPALGSPFSRTVEPGAGLTVGRTIGEMEKELILMTLDQLQGDKKQAAEVLGISLKTLYNRLNEYSSEISHNELSRNEA